MNFNISQKMEWDITFKSGFSGTKVDSVKPNFRTKSLSNV
jgi:hypothetical protein